ncbi:MAG: DUF3052 family protein [Acidimicrobiia bacterium]|nr:DUF3052 family protein [Acidimicrobiia bacterium]MCL4292551.1 DUF3052 family protein [Acidimicrobiia bacterium]
MSTPDGFLDGLELPPGTVVRSQARGRLDVVVFFATRNRELGRRLPGFARAVSPGGTVWVAWPRRTSCVATDLDGAAVRDAATRAGLVDAGRCSIDERWSCLGFAPA